MAIKAIPLILCGLSASTANAVKRGLAPEYSVVHTIFSPQQGLTLLPALLSDRPPRHTSSPPQAILLPLGYSDADIMAMRAACQDSHHKVPWLKNDTSVKMPPYGPGYAEVIIERAKRRLGELAEEGKLGREDGLFLY
ncbi:hypothetical protein MNV49_006801 [Pseudohyphozyma bogoriensis]|nr:hypothetical protein MNV49_006801 [Pseudohyphozyma bogoriensis]